MHMRNCYEAQREQKRQIRGERTGEERRGEEAGREEGGWVSVDKTTDLPGFPAFDCSGEEG